MFESPEIDLEELEKCLAEDSCWGCFVQSHERPTGCIALNCATWIGLKEETEEMEAHAGRS
jgi:hypothetical protein